MKLYSKMQMIKNVFLGVLAGIIVAGAGFYFYENRISDKSADITSETSISQNTNNDSEDNFSENLSENKMISNIDQEKENQETESIHGYTVASVQPVYTTDEQQNISVYEKCNEAVVNITTQEMAYDWFFEPVLREGGSGSGSIIDRRGYVVTNVHVISNASKINISLADGSTYEGQVVGKDVESDIAVVKFTPPAGKELKTISFGNSNNLKVGQKVIAIGNPFALERTMTTGIISGLGRPIQESSNVIIRNMIQTDAAINPGNSGGPLLDTNGNMIGINTMIISNSGSSAGIGFAVPVSTARRVVNDLIQFGKVNRGKLAIKPVQMTSRIAKYAKIKIGYGILVSEVVSGSNTAKAGITGGNMAVQYGSRFNPSVFYLGGDIITQIDNVEIQTYADYTSALESKRPGDTVNVTVYRNGSFIVLKVVLDS